MTLARPLRVAAIQMCAELGRVDVNCQMAERLVRRAALEGATWVILPEFFTSAIACHPSLLDAIHPSDGAPYQLLRNLARELDITLGGSFLAERGGNVYNTFVLALPDGTTRSHDKDIPTMWESCYYVGGNDDGAVSAGDLRVGIGMCWELIRTKTVRRLIDRVDLLVGGSCWWDAPESGDDCVEPIDPATRQRCAAILERTPSTLARCLGVPVVHASHAGSFSGLNLPETRRIYRSRFLGEAQIVDGRGHILARSPADAGEAVLVAEVVPGRVSGERDPIGDGVWIPELPDATLGFFNLLQILGPAYYERVTLPHRLALQRTS
jgi:predicted amidohydrolase